MSVNDSNFLVKLKEVSSYSVANKWVYLKTGNPHYWEQAVKIKGSSCANGVCLALQLIDALKKNQLFYFDGDGVLQYQAYGDYSKSQVKTQLFTYFDLIKVGTTWKTFKSKAKVGDICGWSGHTSVFAGKNAKGNDVWYDWGRGSTYKKEAGSKFESCHRAINRDKQKCTYVLRLKEKYRTLGKETTNNIYYKKYTGTSLKIDVVLKAVGAPEKYYGSVSARRPIAEKNGISEYSGSASQNLRLITLAKKGTLKKV